MTLLVVSPHLDDAVLSCGEYLSAHPATVLTVFAGSPPDGVLTDYDAEAGFTSSAEAMGMRRLEDDSALALLGCDAEHKPFLDGQYAPVRPTVGHLAVVIDTARVNAGCDAVLGPLGLQHPDHALVSDACARLATDGIPVWLYEELPYRVVWPELVEARKTTFGGWKLQPDFLGMGDRATKVRAIACYRSQSIDEPCCLVPERFWRLCGPEPVNL